MSMTVFEGYTVGPVERGIEPPTRRQRPLSSEQASLLALEIDGYFEITLLPGGLSRRDAARLVAWGKRRNICTTQRDVEIDVIRIQRVDPSTALPTSD